MSYLVSIIIPVYNPGDSLRRCLASVCRQTYSDIEIIVVNDGSTDGSDGICREFAEKDSRVIYISQHNSGVSVARNKGLSVVKGEFICFVDSDDFVEQEYVGAMVEAIEKSGADLVIQGLKKLKNGEIIKKDEYVSEVINVAELSEEKFDKIFYDCGPYCKLFRTSIIKDNGIKFPEDMAYGEDAVFYYDYLKECLMISALSTTDYNYLVANPGSLSTKVLSPDKFWQDQINRRCAYKKLKIKFGINPTISKKEYSSRLAGVSGMLNAIFKSGADDMVVAQYIERMITDSDFDMYNIKSTLLKYKIVFKLVRTNSNLSRMLLKQIYR